MSRCGYSDNLDQWTLIRWRGQVASAIRGKRGQAFLRELLAALDAMPAKRLVTDELIRADGEVCALGCIVRARGVAIPDSPPGDVWDNPEIANKQRHELAALLGVAHQLVAEIEFLNDEVEYASPESRWMCLRGWVAEQLHPSVGAGSET